MTTQYALDNDWQLARQRLAMLEAWADPGTIRHLEARGTSEGWHCLEVGAGGGSITEWLCQQVGDQGRVVATDINPRFVEELDYPALHVVQHNVAIEELPEGEFDLVHARAVLGHVPEREEALGHLVGALKPGGWLVVEEFDFSTAAPDTSGPPDAADLYRTAVEMHNKLLTERGVDVFYGNRLLSNLRRQDLTDIVAEGRLSLLHGGTAGAEAWRLTFEQLSDELVSLGPLTRSDIDWLLDLFSDVRFTFTSQILMAAWGRRPDA